jgi:hypothetical protein
MKILKITGIVLLVIIILMIVLPFLFKDQIVALVKEKANENLNAVVNFEDVGLNFFTSFPDLNLSLDELTIINKAPFEGDTLVHLKEFNAAVDLWSVIGGDQIKIKSVNLIEPNIYIYVSEDSTANYDIAKSDTAVAVESQDTAQAGISIALKSYSIKNGNIAYLDQTSDMFVVIRNLNHEGSGDFSKENFLLETETTIGEFTVEKGGVKYLNKAKASADINLDADMGAKKFTFNENEVRLNNLALKFGGFVQTAEESMLMDVNFASVNNQFKDIISLIPAVYTQNFDDLEASGQMSLKGVVKGEYKEESLPNINIDIAVNNGRFKYPKLPTPVNNVNMQMNISNPGGNADNTVINMSNLHLELGNEPFDARLLLRNPTTTPFVDTKMKGRIDLAQLKNAVYLEGVTNLAGIINADFEAKGTIAGADQKSIENLAASGTVSVSNLVYGSENLADEIRISRGTLQLSPKTFSLNDLNVQIGKSDLRAEGKLENIISYVLSDGTIRGNLTLTSNYFNINPFMTNEETKTAEVNDTAKIEAVSVPERINFTMSSNFKTLVYDNLTLTDVKGTITIANERVTLNNFNMNTLGGNLTADGFYHAPEGASPDIMFNLGINNFGFKEAYENFVTVQQFAPMARYIDGKFNSKLSLTSTLDNSMKPVWDSFSSKGSFTIQNAAIKGFKPLQVVGEKLNLEALKNPSLNTVATSFTITDGRLHISPFDFKVLNYTVNVAGSNGLDQSLDYVMGVDIPAGQLKEQGNKAISGLLGRDLQLIKASSVKVKANIGGTVDNPTVSTSAGDIVEDTKQQVTEQVKEEVTKQIEQKKEEVQQQVKQEAQKQADTLTNKVKQEAEKKLKDIFKKR